LLPVYSNKFITPIEMNKQEFDRYYEEYTTHKTEKSYYRLDEFIPNPAPPNIPLVEVMKKAGALLTNVLNLKTQPYPSIDNIKLLCSSGKFNWKDNQKGTVE